MADGSNASGSAAERCRFGHHCGNAAGRRCSVDERKQERADKEDTSAKTQPSVKDRARNAQGTGKTRGANRSIERSAAVPLFYDIADLLQLEK